MSPDFVEALSYQFFLNLTQNMPSTYYVFNKKEMNFCCT